MWSSRHLSSLSATGIVAADEEVGEQRPWRARGLVKSLSLEAATSPPIILAGLEQRTSLPESSVATAAHFDQIWQVCGTWAVAYFCSPDDGMPPPLLRPVNESVWLETIQISCMQRSWLRAYTDVLTSNLLRPHCLWILAETSLATLFVVAEQALHIVDWDMELCEREAQELEQRRREEELRLQEAARSRV